MNFGRKFDELLKSIYMRVADQITEARIRTFNPCAVLADPLRLQNSFDPRRIKIYWPSSYRWPITHKWLIPLLNEFRRHFLVEFKSMPLYEKAVLFELVIDKRTYTVAIDRFDKVEINEKCAAAVDVYFKMQYAKAGYSYENVVPGGFIPAYSSIYLYLDELRSLRDRQRFLYDAYGRFGGRFAKTIRGKAVSQLMAQEKFAYYGGIGKVSYKKSLYEVARSKVCVDLPGVGPFCFRLVDYLAVGSCVIAYPHDAEFPTPLIPGKEIIYCKKDLSDLNDLCYYYITHEQEREAIAQNARAYFDRHLSRPRLAEYYVNKTLNRAIKC